MSVNEHIKKKRMTSLKRLLNIVFFIEFKSINTYITLSRIDCIKNYDKNHLFQKKDKSLRNFEYDSKDKL